MANPHLSMDSARSGSHTAGTPTPRANIPGGGSASPGPGMLGLNARLPAVNEPRNSMGLGALGLLGQNLGQHRGALGLQQLQLNQAYARGQAGLPGQPQSHLPPR